MTMPDNHANLSLSHALAAIAAALVCSAAVGDDLVSTDRRAFADGLLARGMYRLALPEYKALAAQDPAPDDLDTILYRLAECLRNTGDAKGAVAVCERIVKDFPASKSRSRAAITHALALNAIGDSKRAADIFDSLATDPSVENDLRFSAMFFAGESKLAAGDDAGAKSRFGSLVQMAPENASQQTKEFKGFATLYLAEIASRAGTPDAVQNALRAFTLIAEKPITPRVGAEALFKGAVLAYREKKFDEAVARFAKLAATYPDDLRCADALLPATWANFNAGRYAEALALAEKTAAAPKSKAAEKAECAYVKAASLNGLLRREEAVAAFDELIASYPKTSFATSARYERLVALFKNGSYARVLAEAPAFTDPPESIAPDIIWLQAESAQALGDAGRAAQFYRMLADRHPQSRLAPDATYRYATRLRESKSWIEAAKGFQRLVASYPDSPLVPYALRDSGCCLVNAKRPEEAMRDFDTLVEKFPNDQLVPEALLQKAIVQHDLGQLKEAGASLDVILSKHPSFARIQNARFERARVSYELGEQQVAEKLLRQVLAGSPSEEMAQEAGFLLGIVLQAQGRAADAAAQFQPLLAESMRGKIPDDRLVWLADFQFSRGNYAEAAEAAAEIAGRKVSPEILQSANVILARSQLAMSNTNAALAAFRAAADSPARTRYAPEAALRLGELLLEDPSQTAAARRYFEDSARRASSADLVGIRARAYQHLAILEEKAGNAAEAIRLHLALSLLFDDKDIVPASLAAAARLLEASGRAEEAASVREDLRSRFPEEATK